MVGQNKNIAVNLKNKIFLIRSCKVMISTDLAELYNVEPRVLIQAVKRNIHRFPEDFMFQLTDSEFENLKSQFVISSWGGLRRSTPYAFTEQGVAMLSSVLNSTRAIEMNIEIIRTFVELREIITSQTEVDQRMKDIEKKQKTQEDHLIALYTMIKALKDLPIKERSKIGFVAD